MGYKGWEHWLSIASLRFPTSQIISLRSKWNSRTALQNLFLFLFSADEFAFLPVMQTRVLMVIYFPPWVNCHGLLTLLPSFQTGPPPFIAPGGGNGNPLQYSCVENPIDRGAWWATFNGVEKALNMAEQLSMLCCCCHCTYLSRH